MCFGVVKWRSGDLSPADTGASLSRLRYDRTITGKASQAYLGIPTLTNATAGRVMQKITTVCLETRETTRSDFGIALLADTATVAEPIHIASQTKRADFFVA